MVAAAMILGACGNSGHKQTGQGSPTSGSTVTVIYTATSRSTSSDPATITYIDPTDGAKTAVAGMAIWEYTWHVRADKPVQLRLEVVGPVPNGNSCGISVNGQRVTKASGQGGEAGGTPVVCDYTLSP